MISTKKKILIPVLALLISISMIGPVFADLDGWWINHESEWEVLYDLNYSGTGHYNVSQTRLIQRALNSNLLAGLAADGSFGPLTESKVKSFQTVMGLTSDGKVGYYTWAALENNPAWSSRVGVDASRQNLRYIEYKSPLDSSYNIRWYEDGRWAAYDHQGLLKFVS